MVEQTVAEHPADIAAIITEPVMCNNGCISPEPGYLDGLRALCDRHNIALIFDEVITGFRMGMGGAQSYFDVTPDLAVFAKAVANGYPLSVLAGKRVDAADSRRHGDSRWNDEPRGRYYYSGTGDAGCIGTWRRARAHPCLRPPVDAGFK